MTVLPPGSKRLAYTISGLSPVNIQDVSFAQSSVFIIIFNSNSPNKQELLQSLPALKEVDSLFSKSPPDA